MSGDRMKRTIIPAIIASLLLAGCTGDDSDDFTLDMDGAGTMEFIVVDDAPRQVDIQIDGAWVQQAGNGSWISFVAAGETLSLSGGGEPAMVGEAVPAGAYEQVRIVFSTVTVDGEEVLMAEAGVELPLTIPVTADGVTGLRLTFDWDEALFESTQGTAFTPALAALDLHVDGEQVAGLEAAQIEAGGAKAPVARMRVFDDLGIQVFQSDFVADDGEKRVVGNAGNVTFTASASEALADGATIESYDWDFGDGATAEGQSVVHFYETGGNITASLTVTDSNGVTDTQTVDLALKPPLVTLSFDFDGIASGVLGEPGAEEHVFAIDNLAIPDVGPAVGISTVHVVLGLSGASPSQNDLDLEAFDGDGRRIDDSGNSGSDESFTKNYQIGGTQPAPGDWVVEVIPFAAAAATYEGTMTITWQSGDDLGYLEWIDGYDDGHDHQH